MPSPYFNGDVIQDAYIQNTAEKIADAMNVNDAYPICAPFNVSQVAAGDQWCATFPDRSVLLCNYTTKKTRTYVLKTNADAWAFMRQYVNAHI